MESKTMNIGILMKYKGEVKEIKLFITKLKVLWRY